MNSHLVTVKVSIKRRTNQWVKVDRLPLYQHRLKRLDAQTVKGWRPVQHHRMLFDHFLQDIPNFWTLLFHHALRSLDGGCHTVQL